SASKGGGPGGLVRPGPASSSFFAPHCGADSSHGLAPRTRFPCPWSRFLPLARGPGTLRDRDPVNVDRGLRQILLGEVPTLHPQPRVKLVQVDEGTAGHRRG